MGEHHYRLLITIAIVLTLAWVAWSFYDKLILSTEPGELSYQSGSNYFADGHYDNALEAYQKSLQENPGYMPALRGRAETLIMLDRETEAIALYDELIALDPSNAGYYANRGIANDRLGHYQEALENYEKALQLDKEIGEGPSWLTRFLRNQPEKPPGITERAIYLRSQLALSPSERVMSLPELDEAQRPYKK